MWAYCTEGVTLYKWACWRMRAVGSGVRPLFQYTLCQRLSWGPDIYRCSVLASDSGKTLTNILTNLRGSYVSVIKGFREKLDIRRMHTCRFLLLLPCFHSFVFSFVPLDSPFFNTPFLDFKRIFYSSCCDGKCIVTSLSVLTRFAANNMSERERKKERKGCLNDLFHCMATCLNDLEHCGRASHTQQPLVKWQTGMCFLFH